MNSGVRYFITTFAVIILLIIGIVWIVRSGGSSSRGASNNAIQLQDYVSKPGVALQANAEGPINAPENHRTIQVTITPLTRQIDIIAGYQGQVIATKTYDNNQQSFEAFAAALARAGFTQERAVQSNNSESICAAGSRTHYRIIQNGDYDMNHWTASCTAGTFGGDAPATNRLFQLQIPDYNTITNGVSMGSTSQSTGLVL